MKTNLTSTALLLTILVLFSNCASIVSKSSYPISISTRPEGATVSVVDKTGREVYKGTSPATVTLKSGAGYFQKAEYLVKLTSPGYAEKTIPVNFKINGWYFGNFVSGLLLGFLIIDPLTGAMWKLETPAINEDLRRSTTLSENSILKIIDIHNVPDHLKGKLVRIK